MYTTLATHAPVVEVVEDHEADGSRVGTLTWEVVDGVGSVVVAWKVGMEGF